MCDKIGLIVVCVFKASQRHRDLLFDALRTFLILSLSSSILSDCASVCLHNVVLGPAHVSVCTFRNQSRASAQDSSCQSNGLNLT